MFHTLFTEPILNGLVILHNVIPGEDFGIAIIILTLIIRSLLIPIAKRGIESQRALTAIQPEIKALRKKHKDDPQKMTKETMELYKKEGIHPMSGFVPLLVQLPVIFGLFRAIGILFPRNGGMIDTAVLHDSLYGFVTLSDSFSTVALGGLIQDLAGPSMVLAVLAGIAQYGQSHLTFPKKADSGNKEAGNMQNMMQSQMKYIFPVLTVFIAASFPAALALYWFTTTVFGAGQQYLLVHKKRENS